MFRFFELTHSVREDRMVFTENIRKHYLRPYIENISVIS